jgi:hypothetical protein
MKKLKIQMNGRSDEFGTPKVAWDILKPYIKEDWTIWESAWGKGELGEHMIKDGFEVVGTPLEEKEKWDFFIDKPIQWDCIITNPPYSIKEKFLRRCFELETPFALLMPLTALEGKKRGELYKKYGIQLIIPNKRINFRTPSGKGSGAWFQTAWFCYGLNLPKDLMFVELTQKIKGDKTE